MADKNSLRANDTQVVLATKHIKPQSQRGDKSDRRLIATQTLPLLPSTSKPQLVLAAISSDIPDNRSTVDSQTTDIVCKRGISL
jgi:hypothetical protein